MPFIIWKKKLFYEDFRFIREPYNLLLQRGTSATFSNEGNLPMDHFFVEELGVIFLEQMFVARMSFRIEKCKWKVSPLDSHHIGEFFIILYI